MRILLTNDDGIGAPGIAALARAAKTLGDVHVVAPAKVRSACGHAVTFHRRIATWPEAVVGHDGAVVCRGTAVEGMPADCVKVGLARLVPAPVDLVLSGINAGCNVGIHTLYSGTVAAAREAAINGVPAISISLFLGDREAIDWSRATAAAALALGRIFAAPLPAGTFLNVNIPILDGGVEPKGLRVGPTNPSPMNDDYAGEPDADGRYDLRVGQHVSFGTVHPGTDTRFLFDGWITVTPMKFDPTDHDALAGWRRRLETGP
jgi:5'-nucleotidase